MAELGAPPVDTEVEESEAVASQSKLTPMQWPPQDYVPGRYAPWYCGAQENGQEEIYGPDELGEYVSAVEELTENANRCDDAARRWEVLQAWEQRLFRRNYHFLNAGQKGWGMWSGMSGTSSGASIMQTQNSMKLFSCNVYGSREKKITALLSREVPGMGISALNENDPMDQAASEEAEKYLKVFNAQCNLHGALKQGASYFYTDGRVGFLTYTVADQSRWGEEAPDRQEEGYGLAGSDGVTPETELEPAQNGEDQPARREVTEVFGKLETKVPLMCDHEHEMGWIRFQKEKSANLLKQKYPWVKKGIATQGNVGGMDQMDRMARINVRLAVQASSSSGEAYKNDATETVTFYRPSEYEGISDDEIREVFYETFPDGLEVWHAGGQLAFVRNCRITQHAKIVHASAGDGQNRESIGTNYLPLQKVLNANISLLDRYFRAAVPRRFAMEPYIDTQVLNTQSNDPSKVTPVTGLANGMRIADITGIENTPQPNPTMLTFIQWLIQEAPDAMDGGTPAIWGIDITNHGRQTFGEARLNRDQALQVFSMPWSSQCEATECISLQAVQSASRNRVSDINASLPGQQKLKIEIEKLQGSVLIQRVSDEIPASEAEIQEMVADLIENSASNPIYSGIVNNPANLPIFSQLALIQKAGLDIEGAQQAEQQQGEFEILMRSGPQPNPQLMQIQQQLQSVPPVQTPETQQMLQQLTQMAQTLPPNVSTVPVAQNTSENHLIHAAITLKMMTSATGRKLKNGNEQQKAIYENYNLHWQEHMAMVQKLQPPPQVDMKANVAVDVSKLPPPAQAKAFQALGLAVSPAELTPVEQEHEQTIEQEGVNAQGIPTKKKISVVGKPLQ